MLAGDRTVLRGLGDHDVHSSWFQRHTIIDTTAVSDTCIVVVSKGHAVGEEEVSEPLLLP